MENQLQEEKSAKELFNGFETEHLTNINGGKSSGGTYFYAIEIGNFVETKKAILVK